MNRLIAESLACIIIAALFFMCGFLLGGERLGMFCATLSLSSSLGFTTECVKARRMNEKSNVLNHCSPSESLEQSLKEMKLMREGKVKSIAIKIKAQMKSRFASDYKYLNKDRKQHVGWGYVGILFLF